MSTTVFANSRGADHKGASGMSIVFPDVCKTPAPPAPFVPIPYPNIGQSSDTSGGPSTVKLDGKMPMTKGAKYSRSQGDEAGTIGGMISSVNMSECEYMLYSFDVKFEDKGACRLGDSLFHNKKNMMG
jgi:uncharacterized protein DUF4150